LIAFCGLNPSNTKAYMNVHASNHPALLGKNALILLYDVASENQTIGMITIVPNPTNNPAIAGLDGSNAIPIPIKIPIGIINSSVANPLKK